MRRKIILIIGGFGYKSSGFFSFYQLLGCFSALFFAFFFGSWRNQLSRLFECVPEREATLGVECLHLGKHLVDARASAFVVVRANFTKRLEGFLLGKGSKVVLVAEAEGANECERHLVHLERYGHRRERACEGEVHQCCFEDVVLVVAERNFVEAFALCVFKHSFAACPRAEEAGRAFCIAVGFKGGGNDREGHFVLLAKGFEVGKVGLIVDIAHLDVDGLEPEGAVVVSAHLTEELHQGERIFAARQTNKHGIARAEQLVALDGFAHATEYALVEWRFLHWGC